MRCPTNEVVPHASATAHTAASAVPATARMRLRHPARFHQRRSVCVGSSASGGGSRTVPLWPCLVFLVLFPLMFFLAAVPGRRLRCLPPFRPPVRPVLFPCFLHVVIVRHCSAGICWMRGLAVRGDGGEAAHSAICRAFFLIRCKLTGFAVPSSWAHRET